MSSPFPFSTHSRMSTKGTDTPTKQKQVIIKWRGKPVFIRHRTDDEIKDAEDTDWEKLRDPQPDSDRVKRPEWLIMLGTPSSPPLSLPLVDEKQQNR